MHRVRAPDTTGIPLVAFDFAFFREGRGMTNIPVLVLADKDSGCVGALPLPDKSSFPSWVAPSVCRLIQSFGHHGALILKSDRENALMDIIRQVAQIRPGRTQIETGALGDSQSNGRAERAVQSVEMMTRTLKLVIEARIGHQLPVECAFFTWVIRHAADLYNKYQVGRDRQTPYQRARGRLYTGELLQIGSLRMYRVSGPVQGGL